MSSRPETYQVRIDKCVRYERMIAVVAAGLLGEIACIAAGAFNHAPYPLQPIAFTVILLAAFFLVQARVNFDWLATRLNRQLMTGAAQPDTLLPNGTSYRGANYLFRLGLISTGLGGALIVAAAWFPPPNPVALQQTEATTESTTSTDSGPNSPASSTIPPSNTARQAR